MEANLIERSLAHRAGSRARRIVRRALVATAVIFAGGYLLLLVLMMLGEESLIFFPDRKPIETWDLPGVERVRFKAADGTRLHGWFFPCPNARAVVLFACGNGGNISYRAERLAHFCRRQHAALFAFDYRGYGLSEGQPNEPGVLMDARAARAWLADRTHVPESDIVLLGESLGGGVMVDLASRDGARGLILERTFTSLPDVGAIHFPFVPVRLLMRSRLDSLGRISGYRGPLLIGHGDADEIIPFEMGRRLFEAANEPKRFVAFAGVGHNEPLPEEWDDEVERFLSQLSSREAAGRH